MDGSAPLFPMSPAAVAWPAHTHARAVDRRLFARRAARIAAGLVLTVGGVALPINALAHLVPAGALLGGTWAAALLALPLVWLCARAGGHALAGRLGDRLLVASLAWPLAGLALLLPLSLHSLVMLGSGARELDEWVGLSWAIVGHVHVALAGMAAWRMRRLVRGEPALSAAAIYGISVGVAMVPGAIFLLIPPLLVAATGLPFLFLLWAPAGLIRDERERLA